MKLSNLAMFAVAAFTLHGTAQSSTPVQVDETKQVALHGSVSVLAQARLDRGAVADDFPVQRALVMLQPTAEREAALRRFLREAHSPSSVNFHKWITPEQYGDRFGATDDDIAAVTKWLQNSGFSVARVTKSKAMIEFSGTAAQVRSALHTEIHQYAAGGTFFYSNDREITVPAAIALRIRNFAPLNSIAPESYVSLAGSGQLAKGSHRVTGFAKETGLGKETGAKPEFTTTANNAPFYALAPEDFATQYDLGPVYSAGTKGDGQTIGIIGTANLNLALVDAYRTLFNLPASQTSVIVDGEDPGAGLAPDVEGFLDVEVSGGVAPDAAINYYIASGQPLQDSLALAALRAIDDNQAAVLSVSYGECEQLLGNAGNQLWNGLWQQAAAQGQTVLVASGDSGPTACPLGEANTAGDIVFFGTAVSGLTSTPWNVSVGGTDFYYADYATGGASIATLWNQANDGSLGSLKAPLPEQPWDAIGPNIVPFIKVSDGGDLVSYSIPSPAGGGGSSTCSQQSAGTVFSTPPATCTAGYPKPAWQSGEGVPPDDVRDIPDLSLFAANGDNLTAWPICAEPGDCNGGASSAITLVGGTSSSTPAMAGIMALINQKYGRQGQADYTLYALAQQQASTFHDITIGSNDVLCDHVETPGCDTSFSDPTVSFPLSFYSYGVYAAGTGYDRASGLGSIDANLLLTNWTKATTTATTTSLQLTPVTVTHGAPTAVTALVKASSGPGTPTGEVVLETSPTTALRGDGLLTLSAGLASGSVATLPGGTYNVVAQYSGDGVYEASTSSPVALTVSAETSTTVVKYYCSFQVAPGTTPVSAPPGEVHFGDTCTFEAIPTGQSSGSSGLATGSVTFTDGSTTITVPLNVHGVATWTPQTLALGAHTITASYTGDGSYMASTANGVTLTVIKGTPVVSASVLDFATVVDCASASGLCTDSFAAGSSLTVHVVLRAADEAVAPTGTVTVSLGALSQTVPVGANIYLNEGLATAFATLANVPAGTYTLTASYSGDNNWNTASYGGTEPLSFVAQTSATAPTTTTLAATSSSVDSSSVVTFNVTVQAESNPSGGAPIGEVFLLANGSQFAGARLGPTLVTPSLTESATIRIPSSELPVGAQQIIAVYSGIIGFGSSSSAPLSLNVSDTEFTLASGATSVAVASGKIASAPILLGTEYGLTASVALTCTPSTGTLACSLSSPSVSVTGSGTAVLTISAFTTPAAIGAVVPEHWRWMGVKSVAALACLVMLGFPQRRRRWPLRCLLALVFLVASGVCLLGCGGSKAPTPPPIPPPVNPVVNTTPGTYSVMVQGVSGGVTHNVKIAVAVQ